MTPTAAAQPAAGREADAAGRGQDHAARGRKLYDLRRYEAAIKEFEQAYQSDNDPAHLYNIAQAHRLANHVPEAIAAYRAYLDRMPEAPNRPDVERRIAELSAAQRPPNGLDPQPAAPPPPAPAPPAATPAPAPAPGGPPGAPAVAPTPLLGDPASAPAPQPAYGPGYPQAPVLAAAAPPPGHHRHDGFFLRAQLGLGYTTVTADQADLKLKGGSGHFALAAGGALSDRFVLYAELASGVASEPDVELEGQSATLTDGEMSVTSLGVGGALYIMPANVYLSATASAARLSLEFQQRSLETRTGFGLTLSAGKEWWVGRDVGIGLAVQLHGAAMKEDVATDPDTLMPAWISLLFSGTYN
jgi:tetratricopeptide (TPR) repeat protein